MASKAVKTVKIPDDIEYRVIGNLFGILIASAGILGGTMMNQRSFEYWADDIVPIVVLLFLLFRLFRNLLSTMIFYQDSAAANSQTEVARVYNEAISTGSVPRIGAKNFTPEQVVEEVAKRIEVQKEAAQKKNKMVNS